MDSIRKAQTRRIPGEYPGHVQPDPADPARQSVQPESLLKKLCFKMAVSGKEKPEAGWASGSAVSKMELAGFCIQEIDISHGLSRGILL